MGAGPAALRLWPDFVQARANLGLAFSEEGRTAEAVAELEEAVRAKPDYPEAQAYLGLALFRAGRPAEAAAASGVCPPPAADAPCSCW